ncbi:hypothetical protein VOLCADRAFT_91168 [Volvox carteri f. nagariensis]|uniref:JmjC domain-containing protein n=1 Tax=Volvox carteri f. nagariensis TaxID=3068 RepID=D8TWC9_VOLCA|nr:uncharacterized protein VOLCADRAFT_91168 [Volvox carteri f. nagariensis]EFJ48023.1 hypothetical protein VOLCADRAFT_91168 [Volvox carteri f. nagariensis]|eukprot:XP_002950708.1 hypothetical protein VOLCADRAFT_91168 [Volvox carteri f. nagariensis]
MKGIREVYTTEQLYEQLRPRLSISDVWLAQHHPDLLRAADAMVEALQKKESYGGGVAQGGAGTALEYLTTTFAHLREQRTLVMGDKKDRLLKEVAGLRQLRSGTINVLRGAKASETTMADMLSALKAADANPQEIVIAAAAPPPPLPTDGSDRAVPMELSDSMPPPPPLRSSSSSSPGAVAANDGVRGTIHQTQPVDTNATATAAAGGGAELYQDMIITPQRTAAARPQRKRQRTAAEETVQTLDESPDSLDFVDFVEALHRRMPLRCGWMYANAILPNAAGRLSGLYDGGPELDALGRSCLAFHHTRHESPVLDVHVLASQLRQQQQQQRVPSAWPRNAVELVTATAPPSSQLLPAKCASSCCASPDDGAADAAAAAPPPSLILRPPQDSSGRGQGLDLGHLSFTCVTSAPLSDDFLGELIRQTTAGQAAAEVAATAAAAAAARASRCIASGRVGCTGTCVEDAAAAAAAAEVAAAAAADYMTWGGVAWDDDAAAAAAADEADEEERELYDAVNEELQAVEAAAVEAEREVEVEMEMMEKVAAGVAGGVRKQQHKVTVKKEEEDAEGAAASAAGGGGAGFESSVGGHHLKGAFSHRMQLLPGVFFSYYIGSQAFTNTAWHVEDFLLQSINLMAVGRPKAWWWVPRDKEEVFKEFLEDQWDAEE